MSPISEIRNVIVPSMNLNGTSKEELQYQAALTSYELNKTLQLLEKMSPHGRDYPLDTLCAARKQWRDWYSKLEEVQEDLVKYIRKLEE
jgi:hypothetical protein